MERLNSGVNNCDIMNNKEIIDELEVFDEEEGLWVKIGEAYFEESKNYKWRYKDGHKVNIIFNGMPLPAVREGSHLKGNIIMPFFSGNIEIQIISENTTCKIRSFVYPDSRKVTLDLYLKMVSEILEEANLCFKLSDFTTTIDFDGFTKEHSWAQWIYIKKTIKSFKNIINKLIENPIRHITKNSEFMNKQSVRKVDITSERWIDRNSNGIKEGKLHIPDKIYINKSCETYDIYENRVVKYFLISLKRKLQYYKECTNYITSNEVEGYIEWINYILKFSFLKGIESHKGVIEVTQLFRKSPLYKYCFNWFKKLEEFKKYNIGMSMELPLSETYAVYEIWAFMKFVKIFREKDMIKDTSKIFLLDKKELFLNLGENIESKILLKDGSNIIYQRIIQSNSSPYYSYTQRMIPDITVEKGNKLLIFDPKYRVGNNIRYALTEMHKYRDGILRREDKTRAVVDTYIITPASGEEHQRFYNKEFHEEFQMGALEFMPQVFNSNLDRYIIDLYSAL
jgi:hypothetical protein